MMSLDWMSHPFLSCRSLTPQPRCMVIDHRQQTRPRAKTRTPLRGVEGLRKQGGPKVP